VISSEGVRLGAEAARRLAETGLYEFEPGLTDAEFARIEPEYGFEFADDHRAFLAVGLPVNVRPEEGQTWSRPWPEWRGGDLDSLRRQLDWGERPSDGATALDTARRHLRAAPMLVPVYAHRYLPAGSGSFGHPVLSMWQTDVIYYGLDLADYMHQEFDEARGDVDKNWNPRATVPFWRDLV
jgi:hypothetical protein